MEKAYEGAWGEDRWGYNMGGIVLGELWHLFQFHADCINVFIHNFKM